MADHPDLPPDLRSAMTALLDRAADGDVADPPVTELVRRGTQARSRRRLAAAGAVAAVAAATAGVLVATLVLPSGTQAPAPRPAQPQPGPTSTLPAGPTAAQWAHGSWRNIAKAPINTCSAADTAWGGGYLMVVAQNCYQKGPISGTTAALYDPRHDTWARLPEPNLTWPVDVTWTGREWVAVSLFRGPAGAGDQVHAATWYIRPGQSTIVTDSGWRALPPLDEEPPLYTGATGAAVTTLGRDVVVAGLGRDGNVVYRLRGTTWQPLPRLPLAAGHTLPAVSVGVLDGRLYTVATDEIVHTSSDGYLTSTSARTHLLRLDGSGWTDLSRAGQLPALATRMEQIGDRLLVVGSTCPPFARCPASGAHLVLVDGDGRVTGLLDAPLNTPLVLGADDAVAAGRAVVAYDATTRYSGAGGVRPGDSAVWDPDSGRWRTGPSSPQVNDVAAVASTPYGVVVLGRPVEKCRCAPAAGLILRPATR